MTLVGVDLGNDYIREVGTMLDTRSSGHSLTRRRSNSLSYEHTTDDSMYIDIHTDCYKTFGQDVSTKSCLGEPTAEPLGGLHGWESVYQTNVQA